MRRCTHYFDGFQRRFLGAPGDLEEFWLGSSLGQKNNDRIVTTAHNTAVMCFVTIGKVPRVPIVTRVTRVP